MSDDSDWLSMIKALRSEFRRPLTPCWVKGHQDTRCSYARLPREAQLNIDVNFLATRYRDHGRLKLSSDVDHQPTQAISIAINGVNVTGQYDDTLRYHINGYHLRIYSQELNSWSDSTWQEIDFATLSRTYKRLRAPQQVRFTKHMYQQLPLGARRYQQAKIKDPNLKMCPCCKTTEELPQHLLHCPANSSHAQSLYTLLNTMRTSGTHPIWHIIASAIDCHETGARYQPDLSTFPLHLRPMITSALESQEKIGWEQF